MTGWTRIERRWRDALLAALIPRVEESGLPGLGELELASFWDVVEREAPSLVRLGLRTAVWCLTLAPILLIGRPRLFTGLDNGERDVMLNRAGSSRSYLVRQLVTTLKAFACFAYLRDPMVRRLVASRSETS